MLFVFHMCQTPPDQRQQQKNIKDWIVPLDNHKG
jgi:hypothetical protein